MKSFKKYLVGSVFLFSGVVGADQIPYDLFEIINGKPVTTADPLSRSVVNLLSKMSIDGSENGVWFSSCTGTVLGKKYILTAAHCVQGAKPENIAVNFSLNTVDYEKQIDEKQRVVEIEKQFEIRKVKTFKIHPQYDGSGRADLAVLLLEKNAPRKAKPVKFLPDNWLNVEEKKTVLEGQKWPVILMGYGVVSEQPVTDSLVMRATTVPARFEGNFVITDQTQGSGGCNGDSGGPAFIQYLGHTFQVGVTHGPHDGSFTCGEEGQWVNPALDKAFINDAIKTLK